MANTPVVPAGTDPAQAYSPGVLSADGTTLYVSGQVGVTADGHVPSDIAEQCRVACENVVAVLGAAGMGVSDIVKMTTFLIDRADLGALRAARAAVFGSHKAASTLVFVSGLVDPNWKVEIEAVAVRAN